MELDDVYQVASVSDTEVANKLLAHGWKLLKVTVDAATDDRYLNKGVFQSSMPVYILGAAKNVADAYPEAEAAKRTY